MSKTTSIIVWLLSSLIIGWMIQMSYEQNVHKSGTNESAPGIIANENSIKTLLGDGPRVRLTKEKKEASINLGESFVVILDQPSSEEKWIYELDDEQAFVAESYDLANPDPSKVLWGFNTLKAGEYYLHFKMYNTKTNIALDGKELDFKVFVQ